MWIIFALGASLFWGISYVLGGEIYKKISLFTSLGIVSFVLCIITFLISYFNNSLETDFTTIASSKSLLWYVILGALAFVIAELFIGFSIISKNATLAGLIEISYPIFIALFSYLLFKNKITIPTIIGGIIVFLGIFVIYYFNR